MFVTDRHDMALAVKVRSNPNTTNQPKTESRMGKANACVKFIHLSFNYAIIHAISPIIYIYMHLFLRVTVKFYDAVNVIHDVITTADPIPCTAKFMFVGVRNNKTQQIRR